MITTRTHRVIDYTMAVLLLAAPVLLGFADRSAAQWVPTLLGIAIIVYSLLTRYEPSAPQPIPFPVHLGFDVLVGLLLLASPWLFGFADRVWWPHVLLGAAAIGIAALTRRHPA